MFAPPSGAGTPSQLSGLSAFASPQEAAELPSATQVVAVQADAAAIEDLQARPGVRVWPNSEIRYYDVDCRPFQPAVSIDAIRDHLGVGDVWQSGHRGDGIIVGIVDEGIDGTEYPVIGGFNRAGAQAPGAASIRSHGSMCAADVLVAAPEAQLYDYPFLVPRSSSALAMFSNVLEQRRLDGTPHVVSNSWGFYAVPPQATNPNHEIWDIDHPLHRKIREVIESGALVVCFAAGKTAHGALSRRQLRRLKHRRRHLHPRLQQPGGGDHRRRRQQPRRPHRLLIPGPGDVRTRETRRCGVLAFLDYFGPGRPGGDTGDAV